MFEGWQRRNGMRNKLTRVENHLVVENLVIKPISGWDEGMELFSQSNIQRPSNNLLILGAGIGETK